MNPTHATAVRAWCRANGFHPNRVMGQNFLVDANVAMAIVDSAEVRTGEEVLEIGPGLGALSEAILARGGRLTAVEKDLALFGFLNARWRERPDVRLMHADALDLDLNTLLRPPGMRRMVSNLPYSSGTRILLNLVRHRLAPPDMTVTVQREVADRLTAGAGAPDRGLAGVWVQWLFEVRLVRKITPACFWPRPDVASAVVRFRRNDRAYPDASLAAAFEVLTRCAFSHRRKQIAAAFRHLPDAVRGSETLRRHWCAVADVPPEMRAEALTMEQWIQLAATWRREIISDAWSNALLESRRQTSVVGDGRES